MAKQSVSKLPPGPDQEDVRQFLARRVKHRVWKEDEFQYVEIVFYLAPSVGDDDNRREWHNPPLVYISKTKRWKEAGDYEW